MTELSSEDFLVLDDVCEDWDEVTWVYLHPKTIAFREDRYAQEDWRILHRRADGAVDDVAHAMVEAWETWGRKLNVDDMAQTLAKGERPKFDWDEHLRYLDAEVGTALGEVARESALALLPKFKREVEQKGPPQPETFADDDSERWLRLEFSLRYMTAEDFIQGYLPSLIVNISTETQRAVQQVILDGFRTGKHPYQMAEEIRDLVGLLPGQVRAYQAYAKNLGSGSISAARQAQLLADYRQRLRLHRARNIARTETIRAANAGQMELWNEAVNNGLISSRTNRKWIMTPDERLCPYCRSLGGETAPLNRQFQAGPFPPVTQPPLHPSCRCAMGLVFD